MFVIILVSFIAATCGFLTTVPENAAVIEGTTVVMKCQTNDTSKQIFWRAPDSKNLSKKILSGGRISENWSEILSLNNSLPGQYDLVINTTLSAGTQYVCQEGAFGHLNDSYGAAELIVLASNPQCYVNGMPTTSNLTVVDEQEYVEFKCNLTFAGRWNPSMEWKQMINSGNDWKTLSSQEIIGTEGNIYVISATLAVNATENITTYVCTVRFLESARPNSTTAENIPEYSYNWTSPTFVLRFFCEIINCRKEEKEQKDGYLELNHEGLIVLVSATLMASAVLCVVVIIILKLHSSKAHQAITSNSVQPPAIVPMQPSANNTVGNQLDQPVIYSEVKKKTVKDQKVQTNNNQQEMKQPEIYSTVHKPDAKQVNNSSSQQFSIQHENSCKVVGADGTEYSQLAVFQSKQPIQLKTAAKETFETSVYAQIDHTIAPPLPLSVQRPKTYREALKAK